MEYRPVGRNSGRFQPKTLNRGQTMNTTQLRIASNRVRDIEKYCLKELDDYYPKEEIKCFLQILFLNILGWDTTQYLLHRDSTINQSDMLRFYWAVEDLKRYKPIQYIVGNCDFYGCRLTVNEHVLIPRQETEEIVDYIIRHIAGERRNLSIADLCTGSGCIAIALAKSLPDADIKGVDLSEKALEVATENAKSNHTEIALVQADILTDQFLDSESFDIIVSNPPYIKGSEKKWMRLNVLEYEPEMALFVPDNDPLIFYKSIARHARQHLKEDGVLIVEINENHAKEVVQLFEAHGMQATVHQDFRSKDRMVEGRLTTEH